MREKYFERKLEEEVTENPIEQAGRLNPFLREFVEHPPDFRSLPKGTFGATKEKFDIQLEWEESEFINPMRLYGPPVENLEERWARLKLYFINTENGNIAIQDVIPPGWKIIFRRDPGRDVGGDTRADERTIMTTPNLFSWEGILTLLHEAGHAQRIEAMSKEEKEKYLRSREGFEYATRRLRPLKASDADIVIKDERDAWAYALKQLRPVFKRGIFSKDDVIDYIHKDALSVYSKRVRRLITQKLITENE